MAVVVLLLVFVPMLIEARRSARNERGQRARGGVEAPGDVYSTMRVAYPAGFAVMIAEGAWRGWPGGGVLVAGVVVYAFAKVLKWWAISTLGPFWTFRVIVIPGAGLVATGPYAYLRHPNYVAVLGEFIGVALLTGARISGPVASLVFAVLLLKRIAVENRALATGPSPGGRVQSRV
jgi:methyltransferase